MSTDVSSPSLGTKSVGSVGFAGEEIAVERAVSDLNAFVLLVAEV
jgi:hypothetical protein